MSEDIERRLADAAQAQRELEVCGQRCDELEDRAEALTNEVAIAREHSRDEDQDVRRLEGMSLSRVLASLHHSRDDALARERAEAEKARYQAADAQTRLDAVRAELIATSTRRQQLSGAPQAYAAALAEKERYLTESGDPRGTELMRLAQERGRLTAEARELTEAARAAQHAAQALAHVQDRLGSAAGWSTYDTFFGGGLVSGAIKHDRMDEAAQAAAEADRWLATLRTELADVHTIEPTAPQLELSSGLRFADLFFDNFFTDLAVEHRIRQARDRVDQAVQLVFGIQDKLSARAHDVDGQLADINRQRQAVLTR